MMMNLFFCRDILGPEEVFASLDSLATHMPLDDSEALNLAIYPGNGIHLNLKTTIRYKNS